MRILQINTEKHWRGGERQTLLSMQEFRRLGHDVELLTRIGSPLTEHAMQKDFICHKVKGPIGIAGFLLRDGHLFDIIHCQTAGSLTWAVLTKWWYRKPLVVTRRTNLPVKRQRERITALKWRMADKLVTISQSAAQEPRRLGLNPIIIASAIGPYGRGDPIQITRFQKTYLRPGKKIIATAASLTPEKDPETLIRAIACLHQIRQDFLFVHMGTSGSLAAQIHKLCDTFSLHDCYVHAGFQPDVEALYPLFDMFVMSSRHEGLGSSVLDAFAQRIPVVATDAGGLAELLSDGRGILCPTGNYQALASAMNRVLDDENLRHSMVERAYAYVMQEHDIAIMAERYLTLYHSILKQTAC